MWKYIFRNMWRRKGRTFLTVFGIVVGIFALTVLGGLSARLTQQVNGAKSWFTNSISVVPSGGSLFGGGGESYSSATPEPYTFIPRENRTIALADGSITSPFLATFGRASRDTGLVSERNSLPSDTQRLYLLNSGDIRNKINGSPLLGQWVDDATATPADLDALATPDEAAWLGERKAHLLY